MWFIANGVDNSEIAVGVDNFSDLALLTGHCYVISDFREKFYRYLSFLF
jgi:hypothetical protein